MSNLVRYFEKLYKDDKENFYNLVKNNLKNKKKMFIVTSNPETFTYGEKNDNYNKLLMDQNTTLVADGISIVKSAKMLKYDVKERITGIDLVTAILKIGNECGYKISLCGARKEVLEKLLQVIKSEYPNIKLGKAIDGYASNLDDFITNVSKDNVDVLLVALGIPNQEEIIYRHLQEFKKGILIGVGGTFDVLSGTKKRAPKIFRKLNLEWLYRIFKEPSRMKRFYQNNIKFMFKIMKLKK